MTSKKKNLVDEILDIFEKIKSCEFSTFCIGFSHFRRTEVPPGRRGTPARLEAACATARPPRRTSDALLKLLLRSERATGAWAIVNHHTYRFCIDSGALDHDNTMTIP